MCLDCLLHGHQYEIIDTIEIHTDSDSDMPYGTIYVQRCKKCGKIKKKKITAVIHTW